MPRTVTLRALPRQTGTIELGNYRLGFELEWNNRSAGAYITLLRDGVAVLKGKRLNLGAAPFRAHALEVGGQILVVGGEPSSWEDLDQVKLKFYSDDERAPTETPLRVY